MMALAGAAARFAAPAALSMAGQAIGGTLAGKQAENTGEYNERQSFEDRLKARAMNEDPNAQGDLNAAGNEKAKDNAAGRSRVDTIFANQLGQSNNRADLQNTMALNDQVGAFRNGQQLADNYSRASSDQAAASGNVMNSIMNRQATQYRSSY
jgi:hypothetical protein